MASGQVYVTVRADSSSKYSARSIGSDVSGGSGSTTVDVIINWSSEGGITGWYGFRDYNGVEFSVDTSDIEATNAAVQRAWAGANLSQLFSLKGCAS